MERPPEPQSEIETVVRGVRRLRLLESLPSLPDCSFYERPRFQGPPPRQEVPSDEEDE